MNDIIIYFYLVDKQKIVLLIHVSNIIFYYMPNILLNFTKF